MKLFCYILSILLPCAVPAFAGVGVSSQVVGPAVSSPAPTVTISANPTSITKGSSSVLDRDCPECHSNHNHWNQWQQTHDGGRWRSNIGQPDLRDHLHRDGNRRWRHNFGICDDLGNNWQYVWRADSHDHRQSHNDHQGKLHCLDRDCHECHRSHNHRNQWQQTYDGRRWRINNGQPDLHDHLHRDCDWIWRYSFGIRDDHGGNGYLA